MSLPVVVIITGPPGSGKTTLCKRLAADLRLPYIGKDEIKELLFDQLGWSDREWSRKLSRTTYLLMYRFVAAQLRAGCSLVVESNFMRDYATAEFGQLQQQYPFIPVQVVCRTEPTVLFQRIQERAASGDRHPGHSDMAVFAELETYLAQNQYGTLDLGGTVIELDTTDFTQIDYSAVLTQVRAVLHAYPAGQKEKRP